MCFSLEQKYLVLQSEKKGIMVAQITPIYNMIMNNSNKNTRVIKHGKNTWQNTFWRHTGLAKEVERHHCNTIKGEELFCIKSAPHNNDGGVNNVLQTKSVFCKN